MRRPESGFALLIVLLLTALVLITLSVAVPRLLNQGQREREEELIFRGEQYRRAIGRFYRQFGRYPNSLAELLHTNDRSFLRRPFPDPMTPDGEWRLIRVGPNGELIGSLSVRLLGGQSPGRSTGEGGTNPAAPSEGPNAALPLAGVASRSPARAIRVFQGYEQYDHWEFIYDPTQQAASQPGAPTPPPGSSPPTPR